MVRSGVVKHPNEWSHSGYNEIQKPKQRYGIIDFKSYMSLVQIETHDELKQSHQQ
jgi:REP-associated tyrosine transposase